MTSKDKLIEFLKSAGIRYTEGRSATNSSQVVKTMSLWYFFDNSNNYVKSL